MSHEAPLAVFREAPDLIPALMRDALGVDVPTFVEIELAETDFTQVVPAELRADLVLVLRGAPPARTPVMGIVVEVQRHRDERKRWTWPLYLAALHARLACPTCLVVVATDDRIATWAAEPIRSLHPGLALTPVVLGPAQVPRITTAEPSTHPWLAVLSALAHGNRSGGVEIALVALELLAALPDWDARIGSDLILATLDADVRQTLEALMETRKYKYEFKSEFALKHIAEGRAAGLAEGLAEGREEGREEGRLLASRHLLGAVAATKLGNLSDAQRAAIDDCTSVERLEQLVVQVAAAPDAAAVASLLDAI